MEIHTWSQCSAYRKCLQGNPLDTWLVTSNDPKRSRSWPRYSKMQISRKRWEIEAQYQLNTNRKCHMRNRMDTWLMTSRDPERSSSWPRYWIMQISRKRWEIGDQNQLTTNGKSHMGNRMDTWPMTSRDLETSKSWTERLISRKQIFCSKVPDQCKSSLRMRDITWPVPPMQNLGTYLNLSPPHCLFTMTLLLGSDEE